MSLDVQGHEFPILKGIDWDNIQIDVMIIENKHSMIVKYLQERNYEHFPNIHRDHIWIRRGSGLRIDALAISRLNSLNFSSFKFPSYLSDDIVEDASN